MATPVTPQQIIAEARQWVGVPFRHQGRARSGIDCVGLPIVVGQALGVLSRGLDVANYGRLPSAELVERLTQHCSRLPAPVPGSLVAIAWTRTAAHVALCAGDTLIHAYESVGRVVEHGYRGRWLKLTHSAWALPGVLYE
jgi:cell wall-associated NlpC family hydrolase